MAVNETTKICPLCAETIKAAAKVCPYCRAAQNRRIFLTVYDLTLVFAFLFFVAAGVLLMEMMNHVRIFSPNRDRIEVLRSSQFAVQVTKWGTLSTTNIIVVGTITNASPYTWKIGDPEDLEVRFFDINGKTTDTDKLWTEEFTILPHSDHAFRSSLSRKSVPEYATYKIYVRSAHDPKQR